MLFYPSNLLSMVCTDLSSSVCLTTIFSILRFLCGFFFPLALWNDLCCGAEIVLLSYLELKGAFEPWPEADHGGKRCFPKTI